MIKIDGNKVTLIREEIMKEVALDEWLNEISNGSVSIPFLPANCRGIITSESNSAFIIEQEPCTRSINYSGWGKTKSTTFRVHMPWTYYIMAFQNNPIVVQSVSMAHALKRPQRVDSPMGFLPMPNINEVEPLGTMCLGKVYIEDNLYLHEAADDLVSKIALSPYNMDYFRPFDSKNSVVLLKDAFKQYGHKDFWTAQGDPISETVSTYCEEGAELDNQFLYMYSWHILSEKITLQDFMKKLSFNRTFPYQEICNYLQGVLRG